MFDLSKPVLAQPEQLLALSDPQFIRQVCSLAMGFGTLAGFFIYAVYSIRRPRSTNLVLLLGLALLVASAVGPVPVGASFLLLGAGACWEVGIIGSYAAVRAIPNALSIAPMVGADILRAYRSVPTIVDDLRDGTVTPRDIRLAVSRAAIHGLIALAPVCVFVATNALSVLPFLDPIVDATRISRIFIGLLVAYVALALNLRWHGLQMLFSAPPNGGRLQSSAE